jgi:predicted transcriptional regulator of viral defense system
VAQRKPKTQRQRILDALAKRPVLRAREFIAMGVPRQAITRLVQSGEVQKLTRGLYALANYEPSQHQAIIEAQKRVPGGVICLLSALQFHDFTTQNPHEVWIAIDEKDRIPQLDYPPLRIVRFSKQLRHEGVKAHRLAGVDVHVTSQARTVADCFKYRNKIGLDVALEALRDFRAKKSGRMDELWTAAKLTRVTRVMTPYLEAST